MKSILLVLCALSAVLAAPYEIVTNPEGEEYYLLPLVRERRKVVWDAQGGPDGNRAMVGGKGTIFENDRHSLAGTGFVAKQFEPSGPNSVGGSLAYNHLPSRTQVAATGVETRPYGHVVDVTASKNLFKSPEVTIDAYAGWQRRYGGVFGTSKPNWNVGVELTKPFGQ